jgi:hypothetical protein
LTVIGYLSAGCGGRIEAVIPTHSPTPAWARDTRYGFGRRSICAGAMRCAVKLAAPGLRAAKEEIRMAGIADWPTAGTGGQFEERPALRKWNIRIDARIVDVRLGLDHPGGGQPVLAGKNPAEEALDPLLLAGAAPASPFEVGATHPRSGREFSKPEPMNLPEHGTATDAAAQLAGNSPGCHALRPSRLQMRDARIRPGQCCTPAPVSPEFDQSLHHRLLSPIFGNPNTINHIL